jgi:tripartite-type tricarboxylate transporter receptor subunit TctC
VTKRRHLLLSVPGLWLTADSRAQAFPSRPIRYIVPVAAGGGSDFIGRAVCERWAKALGQPFVVDNLGGGGGVIASQTAAKARPDGYTLMQGYVATHGTSPATRRLPYDAVKDFTPIGMIGGTPNVLVVSSSLPVDDLAGFIDYLKHNPGKASYGSAGTGSLTQLVMELFKQQSGTFMLHVPYRGIAPAFIDLMAGQTQAMFPGLAAALPHIRSGRLKALAVTGTSRHPTVKDVPTLVEAGFKGFDALQWYGVVGPAGVPAPIVTQLNETLNATLKAPDMAERLSSEAVEPMPTSPEQFGRYIEAEVARWTALAKERKIQIED